MDAVNFLKELQRRCKSNPDYYGEELIIPYINPVSLVTQVGIWSKENPVKTRQSEFLKQFPDAELLHGNIDICPRRLCSSFSCALNVDCFASCDDCKEKYWLAEVE